MSEALYNNILALLGHIALVIGIFCVGKSIYNFAKSGQSRADYPLERTITLFFVGIIFINISRFWAVITATLGLDKTAVLSAPGAEAPLQQLSSLLSLIGFAFLLKGVYMLKRETEDPQHGYWPGGVTIVAAILIGNAGGIQKLFM
jgi:hypothetical protein